MPREHDARQIGPGPVQHRTMADALHERAAGSCGQLREQLKALGRRARRCFDLDEFVIGERALDLAGDRLGQPCGADAHHRFERVRQGAQMAALPLGEWLSSGHGEILQAGMAKRSRSSDRWLKEHFADPFVKRAQAQGWRSRAAFKLEEIDLREKMFRSGAICIDLGAAPGAWSQYLRRRLGRGGKILATDILPLEPLEGVQFVQGDFREAAVFEEILRLLPHRQVDWVLSDMAPAMSGIDSVDQPRAMDLAELALDLAARTLKPGGGALIKVFQGAGFEALIRTARGQYGKVRLLKPAASRARSSEMYMLAKDYRLV